MSTVLITTHDLEAAGQLRDALQPDDKVEFVTDAQDIESTLARVDDEAALILTGVPSEDVAQSFVRATSEHTPAIPVIALFEQDKLVSAGLPIQLGFDDYFVKPVDPVEVALLARRSIGRKQLQDTLGIVGNTEQVHELIDRVALIAPVGSTVLITGESGVGKELVARGLHKLSPRRGEPFIAVNIAALPETLLESELFGHEKGAFTGAASLRKGMFELADGGTVFLDEVAEMPPSTQTSLLRVLEEREFMRVGGSRPIKVDVRVIAATNRDLRHAVAAGDFRRDLYHRLNVLHIDIPPLRERREDIPLLVHEFIRHLSREHHKEFKGITPEAMEILKRYDWPGNVRELRNLVESMVVLAPGSVIRPEDIPPEVRRGATRTRLPERLETGALERQTTEAASVPAPEMELIFRTLVELKLDMEDLREQFERYKDEHPELVRAREVYTDEGVWESPSGGRGVEIPSDHRPADSESQTSEVRETPAQDDHHLIVFRPGMTMQELEREAIVATLASVDGNRRKASEKLGIGERTLYRKLKEYEIEA